MSLRDCIASLLDKGEISEAHSAYLDGLYAKLEARFAQQFGGPTAAAMASEEALRLAVQNLDRRRQRAVLQISAQRAALDDMGKYRGRAGKYDYGKAAEGLLARGERATAYSNVEYVERVIRQTTLGRLNAMIERHGKNLIGQERDKAGVIDIVHELFGADSGNANAKAIAAAWGDVAEELRLRANAAGAAIVQLKGWRIPQSHDAALVRTAGGAGATMDASFATWRDRIAPKLDRAEMLDHETQQPLDDDGLNRVLRQAFDNIVSDGWASREEGAGGSPSIAARLSNSRVLPFKDADSYLAYQAEFGGTASAYDAMMGHVHGMARDIALMERLGPNPAATKRLLQDVVRKRANVEHGAGSAADEASVKSERTIQSLYDTLAGNNRRPDSRRLALLGSTLRQWQVATKLGSAVLSTTSDFATSALARAYNGLPMTELISGYARHLNPANAEDRMHSARMGFVAEQAGASLSGTARMMADEMGHAVVATMAEGTMRLSGLNAVTEANRQSLGDSFMAQITRDRGKAFDAIDPAFARFFDRYGLGAEGWDAIRATPVEHANGADWILPERIANRRLSDRLLEAIYQEMDVAVPTAGVAVRAGLDRVAPKGTWQGEAIRTLFQFKAFPVTLMMIQWQRAMAQERAFDKIAAFGMFFGASALAGAFALQMKEIAKGRDARPMDSGAFLIEAIAQGGGGGIYGDFVRSTDSRFGSGPLQVISGPGIETLSSLGNLTFGNAQKLAKGEQTHVMRDLAGLARSNTPIAGSLFYTRLAFERGALDTWRRAADPMAGAAFARMERKYQHDYGQGYWWGPGEGGPDHAPDLKGAFGAPPAAPAKRRQGW